MKKLKKFIISALAVMPIFGIAACGSNENSSSNSQASEIVESSTIIEFIDYVANTKISQTVTESSSFFNDGVGYATVIRSVDGDTVFFNVEGQEVSSRFLGVDTPESTGQVEEWGKSAAKFTASKVENAYKIVLQSEGGPATTDSNGRYLSYVWYQETPDSDLRCLNLELVQEGYSYGKSIESSPYKQQFIAAQAQSKALGLKIFGDDEDPNYFYGDALETTIKYVIENQAELIKDTVKVKFDCTITRTSGLDVYAQDYDAETGETYSILLYKGYALNTKLLEVGNRVSICGNVMEYDGQVQVSNMKDVPLFPTKDNIILLESNVEPICETITPADLNSSNELINRRLVKVENVVVGTNLYTTQSTTSSNGAITIYGTVNGQNVTIRTEVLYYPNTYDKVTEDYWKNKTWTFTGIVVKYNGNYQISLVSLDDAVEIK